MNILVVVVSLLVPLAAAQVMVGGWTSIPVDRYDVQRMTTKAMNDLIYAKSIDGDVNGYTVTHAEVQVVSGLSYRLTVVFGTKTCNVTMWNRPWLPNDPIDMTKSFCWPSNGGPKRQIILGGVHSGQLTDGVQKAVDFAEDSLNGKMNSLFRMVSEKVTHITTQVVAGMKYTFDLNLVVSSCMNNGVSMGKGLDACAPENGAKHMTCHMSVLEHKWMPQTYTVLTSNCGSLY